MASDKGAPSHAGLLFQMARLSAKAFSSSMLVNKMKRLAVEPCFYSRENTEVASDSSIRLIRIKQWTARDVDQP
ncbi:hypothetical protein TNIN_191701 [Trichonephila inaurata madagascariensis]|uniref:Uncharacterized protein n=1 Tax=Trichonephila inaurata madagascariensis TaxID=2747483 RepID=A0A8X6MKX3_9ARAC|nr:hypothetical protein TNIN_191701 [Trichonephila inaurata madagascariensis]